MSPRAGPQRPGHVSVQHLVGPSRPTLLPPCLWVGEDMLRLLFPWEDAGPGSDARSGSYPAFPDAEQAEPSYLCLLAHVHVGSSFQRCQRALPTHHLKTRLAPGCFTYLSCAGRASKRPQQWLSRSLPDRSKDGVLM